MIRLHLSDDKVVYVREKDVLQIYGTPDEPISTLQLPNRVITVQESALDVAELVEEKEEFSG